jgi:hypothetical protein
MPGGGRWGVMCGVWWVSVEHLFVLLPCVSRRGDVAGDAGGVFFRLLEQMYSLPAGGDPPPSPLKFSVPPALITQ